MNYSDIFLKSILGYMILGILVASFIGSVVSIIWLLFSKRATKFYIKDSMKYLRLILLCFTLPIIPFFVYPICKSIGKESYINLNNPMIDKLVVPIGAWLFFIAMLLVYRIFHYYCMCRIGRESIPIHDEKVLSKLAYWKDVLGIRSDIRVSHNAYICSPSILYHNGYQILFPVFQMTDRQMEIALLHELVHLKNKDVITKDVCFFVQVLHGWNPLIYFLKKSIVRWAEVICDLTVCELGSELFSAKDYYNAIFEMMEQASKETNRDIMLCLFEKESMIQFRIDKFKQAKQVKSYGRKRILALATMFVLVISALAFVITTHGLHVWYEDSLIGFEKETQKTEVMIYQGGNVIFSDVSKTYFDTHDFEVALDEKKMLGENELWQIRTIKNNTDDLDIFIYTDSKNYVVGYNTKEDICYYKGSKTMSCTFDDETIESIFIKNCDKDMEFDIAVNARK